MRGRIVAVDAASEHGDRHAAGIQRPTMGLAVDASGHATHDDETGRSEVARKGACDRAAVRRARTRADESDRRPVEERQRPQIRGGRAEAADRESPRAATETSHRGAGCSGSPSLRGKLSGHAVRERLGDVSRLDRAPRARAAIVRATRATRARPRPESGSRSTALERSSEAASVRRGGERSSWSRASSTRARTVCRCLRLWRRELRRTRPWHRDGEVEPIEQRARELLPVRGEPLRRARALDGRIPATAARAHVHRSRRAGTAPGRSRARRRARQRRSRPRAAGAATRERSAGTRGARP